MGTDISRTLGKPEVLTVQFDLVGKMETSSLSTRALPERSVRSCPSARTTWVRSPEKVNVSPTAG